MHRPVQNIFPLLIFSILLPACAAKPVEKPKAEGKGKETDAVSPRLVGRVASIPANRRFALIQAYGTWTVETGSVLTTRGPGERTANLRATGEKLGQFAAADIQSGTLETGDGVYTVSHLPGKLATDEAAKVDETDNPVEAEIPSATE